jgi:thiol-disulfide isomerase/thioredoxin
MNAGIGAAMRKNFPCGRVLCATLVVVAFGLPRASGGQAVPGLSPLPALATIRTPAAGAALLRNCYFHAAMNDGADLGPALIRKFPGDARIRAWYLINLARTAHQMRAYEMAEKLDTASRHPLTVVAQAVALATAPQRVGDARARAGRLARRAVRLAPRDTDVAVLAAQAVYDAARSDRVGALAFVDSLVTGLGNPVELRLVRATTRWSQMYDSGKPDTLIRNEAFAVYEAVRKEAPSNFNAVWLLSGKLDDSRAKDELSLLTDAVARSPRSAPVRSAYWSSIKAQKDLADSVKEARVALDRTAYLALTDSAPWALSVVATSMRGKKPHPDLPVIEARLLAKAPRTAWAERVLEARAMVWNDSIQASRDAGRAQRPDSLVAKQKFRESMESLLGRDWRASDNAAGYHATMLFYAVSEDSTYPAEKLVKVSHQLAKYGEPSNFALASIAIALADRKLDLAFAESILQGLAKRQEQYILSIPSFVYSSVGERAEQVDAAKARVLDALAWIRVAQSRYAEADSLFGKALEASKKNATIYYHLGRLRTAQGRPQDAELAYAQGMTVAHRGTNPNKTALQNLYAANHGSMDGWADYLSALETKERTVRRERILSNRPKTVEVAPPFSLPDLGGKIVGSETIAGKLALVHFWGTWCGPCVGEMAELQLFYDKYKADSTVALVTISNDKNLGDLKEWMATRRYTIPTLFDDRYTETSQISGWPTTWFLDRDGRIQYVAVGNTGALVEEWTWRVEALRGASATTSPKP